MLGANIPPEPELRRLGLDIKKIRVRLEQRRINVDKEYRKNQREKQLAKANRCTRGYWTIDSDAEAWKEFGLWLSMTMSSHDGVKSNALCHSHTVCECREKPRCASLAVWRCITSKCRISQLEDFEALLKPKSQIVA
jgi:hypothetical protein